ncbi:MAG: hypothetical protein R3208_08180 [Ketobacteraceae bacterium]|nr:hypothetical protein [Ketobacteraceae bacterium]
MRIAGNSVFTAGYTPSSQQAAADARVERRNEELQQRNTANEEQKRKDLQASGNIPAGTRRDEELGFRRVSASNGLNKQFALYPDEERRLPAPQQRALQAYTDTQNISRVDADIDYLGSIDIFV